MNALSLISFLIFTGESNDLSISLPTPSVTDKPKVNSMYCIFSALIEASLWPLTNMDIAKQIETEAMMAVSSI